FQGSLFKLGVPRLFLGFLLADRPGFQHLGPAPGGGFGELKGSPGLSNFGLGLRDLAVEVRGIELRQELARFDT
ncbi:MAG: hypothetical protein RLZZ253_2553, partial [Verrucomicrobiota bacterium]